MMNPSDERNMKSSASVCSQCLLLKVLSGCNARILTSSIVVVSF